MKIIVFLEIKNPKIILFQYENFFISKNLIIF